MIERLERIGDLAEAADGTPIDGPGELLPRPCVTLGPAMDSEGAHTALPPVCERLESFRTPSNRRTERTPGQTVYALAWSGLVKVSRGSGLGRAQPVADVRHSKCHYASCGNKLFDRDVFVWR